MKERWEQVEYVSLFLGSFKKIQSSDPVPEHTFVTWIMWRKLSLERNMSVANVADIHFVL